MRSLYSAAFWLDALERALKSAAQAPLLAWGLGDSVLSAFEIDFVQALGWALGGFIVSILTSVVSAGIGPRDTASVVEVK